MNQAALKEPGAAIVEDWNPGDVILDLYEVRRVSEGFGEDAEEKDYHQGGFGRVYKVWHRSWSMELAVKVPRREAHDTQTKKQNFIRECETWIGLGLHPHVASCHYVRELGGTLRVFSEYASGGTLADWIRYRRLSKGDQREVLARVLDIAIQFAWGLDYAHQQGLVHQDVKPLNLLLMEDGTAKVTDFGLARARALPEGELIPRMGEGGPGTMLVSGGSGYTPAYCSPEQLAGEKLTRRTDIWSWAVSLLEMFTGEVSWQSGTLAGAALEQFLEQGREEEDIPPMPEEVATLLRRCFRKAPEARPHRMAECAAALIDAYSSVTGRPYGWPAPKVAELAADGLNNRALSMLDLGRPEEAKRLFDEALKLHPDHVPATYNRGLMLWRAGRMGDDKLLEMLRGCEQPAHNNPRVALCLGWIHFEGGDFKAAAERFQKAIDRGGGVEAQAALIQARESVTQSAHCVCNFKGHDGDINSVCLSLDRRRALSGAGYPDNSLKLWDVATGECLRTFAKHENSVNSVCVSANARWALSGSADNTLKLWDLATGECLRTFHGHMSSVTSVCMSADGRWALSGSLDKTLRLWDVSQGACLRIFEIHADEALDPQFGRLKYSVYSVCLSPDARWALSGSGDHKIRQWDMSTGLCMRIFEGHTGQVTSVCVSSDGRRALSGSWDKTVKLWDLATGAILRTLEGHKHRVQSACLSPDGLWALSGSRDNTIKLWDITTGCCLRTFEGHANDVGSVCLSADGCWGVSGSHDRSLKLWSLGNLTSSHRERAPFVYCKVQTAREAIASRETIEAALSQATALLGYGNHIAALAALRKARALSGGERDRQVLNLWHAAGSRLLRGRLKAVWQLRALESGACSLFLSPDGRWALLGSGDNLDLWNMTTGTCLRTFEGHEDPVTSVCLSPDGRWAISGSMDNTLKLWDVATGECRRTFEGHEDYVNSVSLRADGHWALSGSRDNSVKLWDIATGNCLRTFEGHISFVYSACLSSDGRWALSGSSDTTLKLWDVATGDCLRTFEEHEEPVTSICLRADGRRALSGSNDNTLKLWDVATGECLRTFEGHTSEVTSVCLSPDGRWALSGSDDHFANALKLWDVSTGACLRTLEGHKDGVHSVSLSLDGCWALSGSNDETILWELDWDYEPMEPADWAQGARFYLINFLTLHTPYAGELPTNRVPTEEEIRLALTRHGEPAWSEEDFKELLETLAQVGFGWLRPEGIRRELNRMSAEWQGSA